MPEDWGALASREIEELFSDPKASKKAVKDGFLVQQANIYVTQVSLGLFLVSTRLKVSTAWWTRKLTSSKWSDISCFSTETTSFRFNKKNLLRSPGVDLPGPRGTLGKDGWVNHEPCFPRRKKRKSPRTCLSSCKRSQYQ